MSRRRIRHTGILVWSGINGVVYAAKCGGDEK
jgi:hypothetical protein